MLMNSTNKMDDSGEGEKPIKKHVPVAESPHVLAIRALRAINKSSDGALQLTEIPSEFLFGECINFQIWSLILNDQSLKELSEQHLSFKRYFLNSSHSYRISDLFKNFWSSLKPIRGIISLNLKDSKDITDYGLTLILRQNVHLEKLNIAKCEKITDVAIREIGLNCTDIQELNISACCEIEGYGLVAIAECCHHITRINLSKCKKIQKYAFNKLFYHCTRIEELNVSHLTVITDDEIRVLAQNCPNLMTFIAIESVYLSDQSIMYLAQYCIDIDHIDVSRSTMVFRITDTALSALGQKASTLRVLKVSGCDSLTDVGITWMTEGCKALTELDLCKVTRITDAGLRNIANACHSLTSLDISYAKVITDVGVSSLSAGCPNLRHLNCHGVFLLSDPRLNVPSKGAKLESWQSVIGIAALANNCHSIETLNLSGCFRLNIALYSYISTLKYIKVLNLAGCNQSTQEAMEAVAKGCTLIEDLNLSDCGKSINNKSIKAFAVHCKHLRTLICIRCDHIKGHAIKAIAQNCVHLEKLDLSHSKTLTDNMLLYLCEVDKLMKLHTLSLHETPQLTDSILAWLSIKVHNILTLSLRNTSITKRAISSVRDRYPNSDMVYDNNFVGFQPKYRVHDRMFINKYYYMVNGITKIQSKYRVFAAKKRVSTIIHDRKVKIARKLIQRIIRGYLGRCKVKHIKATIIRKQNAALIITSIFHRVIALVKFKQRKAWMKLQLQHRKAMKIQLCFRKHRDFNKLVKLKHKRALYIAYRISKATKIQSIARVYFAKHRVQKIKLTIRKHNEVINRKAVMITRAYRGYCARKISEQYKFYQNALAERRLVAVLRIQRTVRNLKTTRVINKMVTARQFMLRCCILIQALMRGALSRIHCAELHMERFEIIKKKAAIKIQTRLRIMRAQIELHHRRVARHADNLVYITAGDIIVRQARMKLAVINVRKKRAEINAILVEKANREIYSAVRIQALQRGIFGRALYLRKLREKKGKWKELFDEKQGKRFFYNKLSGEIRYRMPQDLLDLIPHPNCDNCCNCFAIIECSVCNELFCQLCFNSVHSGGRRAEHPFRALYDYYNKRLDYGDGVFPCKWPSEVMQDEVQGWMLRIAPIRNPVKSYADGWEVYNENTADTNAKKHSDNYKKLHNTINTTGNSGNNRLFYFNRITFETTYDTPESILEEQRREALRTANNTVIYSTGYYDENNMWIEDTRPSTFDTPYLGVAYGEYDGGYDQQYAQLDYEPDQWGGAAATSSQPYAQIEYNVVADTSSKYASSKYASPTNAGYSTTNNSNNQQQQTTTGLGSPKHYTSVGLMNTQQFNAHYSAKNQIMDPSYNYSISDEQSGNVHTPSTLHALPNEDSEYNSVTYEQMAYSSIRSQKREERLKKKPTIVPKKLFGNMAKQSNEVDYESVNYEGDS